MVYLQSLQDEDVLNRAMQTSPLMNIKKSLKLGLKTAHSSIGIDVCHPDNTGKYTDVAYKALIELLVDLCKRYKLEPTQAIIRHYDMTGKDCPRYYVKNPNEWKKLKKEVSDAMSKDEELEYSVKVLQEKGIIISPEVWIKGPYAENNVRSLVVKVATHLK